MFGPTYRDLKAGDVVRFKVPAGYQTMLERTGRVLRYLTFADHVVCSGCNNGYVVDDHNFVAVVRRARAS
jgi:hypothetical protein